VLFIVDKPHPRPDLAPVAEGEAIKSPIVEVGTDTYQKIEGKTQFIESIKRILIETKRHFCYLISLIP